MVDKKLKINGLIESPLWKKMSCTCKKGIVMEEHPVKTCLHCQYTIAENSIPKSEFTVKDSKGKSKTITEITLKHGSHDDCIGWEWRQ